jgi:hypothetical protein
MNVLVIGDGPRDSVALPILISSILSRELNCRFRAWSELSHLRGIGSAYERKLKYAVRQAFDENRTAIVAVTDADDRPKRKDLESARLDVRSKGFDVPLAIGESVPHFEVWLLDDKKCIALVCRVDHSEVADSCQCHPKTELDRLFAISDLCDSTPTQQLAALAHEWSYERCIHRRSNGLEDFAKDLKEQFKD